MMGIMLVSKGVTKELYWLQADQGQDCKVQVSTNCCKRALHLGDGAIYTYSSLHYHGALTTVGFLKASRDAFILQVRSQEAVVWILNGRLHP